MIVVMLFFVFFFKQKTAYERGISDWSSDVCSSDLDWRRMREDGGAREGDGSPARGGAGATTARGRGVPCRGAGRPPAGSQIHLTEVSVRRDRLAVVRRDHHARRVLPNPNGARSEARRRGKESSSTGRSGWSATP